MMAILALTASAYDFMVNGLAYDINEDGVSVTVTYENDYDPRYNSLRYDLEIPESVYYYGQTYPVTKIGGFAFYDEHDLRSVIIPNTVTEIGSSAFSWCYGLVYVELPNSITAIDSYAFDYCYNLTSIDIPNSVTYIGDGAFQSCYGLTSVTIPNSVTFIEDYTFNQCIRLSSVTIPNSVTSIGDGAFSGTPWYNNQPDGLVYINSVAYKYKGTMPANTSVRIQDGIVSISPECFSNCSGLSSLTISNSVTSIGQQAFTGCSGLENIKVEIGNTIYDSRNNCNAIIETVTNQLISGCKNTNIPNSVTSIGNYAFSGCSGLTSVTIPNSVTSIGEYAFVNCSGLTSVDFPNTVTSIGRSAFDNTLWYDNQPDGLVYAGLMAYKYKGAMPDNTQLNIREGTIRILPRCFEYCSGLTSVTIPNSVTSIGEYAFVNCSGLTLITIPNSVISIDTGAFQYCSGLTSVIIPNSVTEIGGATFAVCSNLTSVTIGTSVTSIGGWAFGGCSGLTRVNICDIGKWCNISFNDITSNPLFYAHHLYFNGEEITDLVIPSSVTEIKEYAFSGCSGLTSLTIPNSVTSIGDGAFAWCSGLTEIRSKIVNVGDVSMGTNVFSNVPKSSCTLKVPVGTSNAYRNANQWNDFSNIKEVLFSSGTVGDLNRDNSVDGTDINIMVGQLLKNSPYEDADGACDLNDDGKVNGIDLHRMISIVLGQ